MSESVLIFSLVLAFVTVYGLIAVIVIWSRESRRHWKCRCKDWETKCIHLQSELNVAQFRNKQLESQIHGYNSELPGRVIELEELVQDLQEAIKPNRQVIPYNEVVVAFKVQEEHEPA